MVTAESIKMCGITIAIKGDIMKAWTATISYFVLIA
ncbi:MAG: hypothetical protein ACI9VO_001098 [Colwellia sp.]|jgi:hypothetical protein